ncbi:rhodanese-like domain-containing protein [Couchioplanes caeruleus]|uniref:Sulfurtransferase n=2 Tax=Couchioplanes caeruleus TaxID=56438 RepID=A0A1K0GWN5_9ACTN|nr:rhodanese-like domain-containing protein [Couchioplanes caeruleus]OJF13819.1 sulfurtransferase [Couchioplanes caeruleus subsp. caeruleus]ROP31195.1 rhodanese-related sulfurtransferase [Couchioplanes caeruleus]
MFGPQVPSVTPSQVEPQAFLLDVREPDEWQAGHAPDAHHMPMMEVPARVAEIPNDTQVVVVCRSGGRSGQVVSYLMGNGWDNVRNLDGGMQAWAAAGHDVVSENGQPARVL